MELIDFLKLYFIMGFILGLIFIFFTSMSYTDMHIGSKTSNEYLIFINPFKARKLSIFEKLEDLMVYNLILALVPPASFYGLCICIFNFCLEQIKFTKLYDRVYEFAYKKKIRRGKDGV